MGPNGPNGERLNVPQGHEGALGMQVKDFDHYFRFCTRSYSNCISRHLIT